MATNFVEFGQKLARTQYEYELSTSWAWTLVLSFDLTLDGKQQI